MDPTAPTRAPSPRSPLAARLRLFSCESSPMASRAWRCRTSPTSWCSSSRRWTICAARPRSRSRAPQLARADVLPGALLAAALGPPMPARAHAVEVIAARLGAVPVEVDADQLPPAAACTPGAHVRERRGGGGGGGGGGQRGGGVGVRSVDYARGTSKLIRQGIDNDAGAHTAIGALEPGIAEELQCCGAGATDRGSCSASSALVVEKAPGLRRSGAFEPTPATSDRKGAAAG